ncbi:hypothetical protein NKH77_52705 [Streptomyces sp. M19]
MRGANLWVRSDGAQLAELVGKVDAGKLQLHVAAHRSVADLAAVHEDAAAGRLLGKTVLLAPERARIGRRHAVGTAGSPLSWDLIPTQVSGLSVVSVLVGVTDEPGVMSEGGWCDRYRSAAAAAGLARAAAPAGRGRSRPSGLPRTTVEDAVALLGPGPVCWAIELSSVVVWRIVAEVPRLGGSPAAMEMLRRGNEATTLRALSTLVDSAAATRR